MADFTPTAEQQTARSLFGTGDSLAIEAGAGTGKTSTLKLLAESTERRGQYVAFNKAIVEESKQKMPGRVACNTAHSLAFRNCGKDFSHRLRGVKRMPSKVLAQKLGISPLKMTLTDGTEKRLSEGQLAGLAKRGVIRFCQSTDLEPEAKHVPYIDGIDIPPVRDGVRNRVNNDRVAKMLVPFMRAIWKDACDKNGSLPYEHDYYLKLWQLSSPKINAQFILFDEAQDANPVMVDIIRQQTHAQLVWVGDSQQQIYTFTGAINALESVGAANTAYLQQSFRFGPAVAEVANLCLEALDAELRITGLPTIPSVVGPLDKPDAILCRTNAAAVRAVLGAMNEGRTVHLVGGSRQIVAFARAAADLMESKPTDHPELACFSDWGEVREYVAQDEFGSDLRLMVSLVDEFGVELILSALAKMADEDVADLVVSTAHKAKGREWDTVQLADDFPTEPTGEELRLLYVAVTRARLQLDISAVAFFSETERGIGAEVPATVPEAKERATDVDGLYRNKLIELAGEGLAQAEDALRGYVESLQEAVR